MSVSIPKYQQSEKGVQLMISIAACL